MAAMMTQKEALVYLKMERGSLKSMRHSKAHIQTTL
jgi:hypothetical protein